MKFSLSNIARPDIFVNKREVMDGYYRFPAINNNINVFVSEDDLWLVSINGGIAHRLTSNLGRITASAISPVG